MATRRWKSPINITLQQERISHSIGDAYEKAKLAGDKKRMRQLQKRLEKVILKGELYERNARSYMNTSPTYEMVNPKYKGRPDIMAKVPEFAYTNDRYQVDEFGDKLASKIKRNLKNLARKEAAAQLGTKPLITG